MSASRSSRGPLDAVLDAMASPGALSPEETLDAFRERTRAIRQSAARPIDGAMRAATLTSRLGLAFAAGYESALEALVPRLRGRVAALAATEAGGAHPRAIETTLERRGASLRLSGKKRWVTLGGAGSAWLVVARDGDAPPGPHPALRIVVVGTDAPGVVVRPMGDVAIVPEIVHAEIELDAVEVGDEDVLEGDGYAHYLKPFRTVEDVHVHAALLAFMAALTRRHAGPRELFSRLAVAAVAARALDEGDWSSPALHVALSASIEQAAPLVAEVASLPSLPDETRRALDRDRPLLAVAGRARAARLERAWEALDDGGP